MTKQQEDRPLSVQATCSHPLCSKAATVMVGLATGANAGPSAGVPYCSEHSPIPFEIGCDDLRTEVDRPLNEASPADPCPVCGGDHDRISRDDCPMWHSIRLWRTLDFDALTLEAQSILTLADQVDRLRRLVQDAAQAVHDVTCPAKWRTADPRPHSALCLRFHEALGAPVGVRHARINEHSPAREAEAGHS